MLDGIRTRNPQIRSLMRYPLRHEHLVQIVRSSKLIFLLVRIHTYYGTESASHFMQVLVAQRIAHQTSNLGVAGSNPVEHVLQQCCGPLV